MQISPIPHAADKHAGRSDGAALTPLSRADLPMDTVDLARFMLGMAIVRELPDVGQSMRIAISRAVDHCASRISSPVMVILVRGRDAPRLPAR